jgi:hypothetical protein
LARSASDQFNAALAILTCAGFTTDGEESDHGEDNGDLEPSLGGMGHYCDGGLQYDLEADGPDGRTYVDAEPSLGATGELNQDHAWAHVDLSMSDGEGEDGGDTEPNGDEADFTGAEDD